MFFCSAASPPFQILSSKLSIAAFCSRLGLAQFLQLRKSRTFLPNARLHAGVLRVRACFPRAFESLLSSAHPPIIHSKYVTYGYISSSSTFGEFLVSHLMPLGTSSTTFLSNRAIALQQNKSTDTARRGNVLFVHYIRDIPLPENALKKFPRNRFGSVLRLASVCLSGAGAIDG